MKSLLKWVFTGTQDYVPHPNSWVDKWVICTKTGEYVHVNTGERMEADVDSVRAVNNSFWTNNKL